MFFLSSKAETSWRIVYKRLPSALMPGASIEVKGAMTTKGCCRRIDEADAMLS